MILETLETRIAKLEADIAARQIGDGYWQRRHVLEVQLRAAIALRDAFSEAAE